jgi:hypothetical protein
MKPKQLSQKAVEREACRVLHKLSRRGSYITRLPAGSGDKDKYGLFSSANSFHKHILVIEARLVDAFLLNDWIAESKRGYTITDGGTCWLKRKISGGDPYREQHQLLAVQHRKVNNGPAKEVIINEGESPLGWLRKRKDKNGYPLICEAQYEAGERLRADFTTAQLAPRVTASWSGLPGRRKGKRGGASCNNRISLMDHVLQARQRVNEALDEVGPGLSGILLDICCLLQGLEEAEKSNGWPQRSGKVVLQIALNRLAHHYGLIEGGGQQQDHRRRTLHWGACDYRPEIAD